MKSFFVILFSALTVVACGGTDDESEVAAPPPTEPEIDIWTAASQGAVTIIQQHIDYGTDVNSTFAIEGVIGTGGTALHIALLAHKHEVAELLIENGADINRQAIHPDPYGGTPLHWAIAVENTTGVDALIEAGANVNSVDNSDTMPLDVAILDLSTFQPINYERLSPQKKSIYDRLSAKGARHSR
ncbi:MAG: ankyrin repeat domain-containing protein [Candidatus Hydrogenedentota bacterium]